MTLNELLQNQFDKCMKHSINKPDIVKCDVEQEKWFKFFNGICAEMFAECAEYKIYYTGTDQTDQTYKVVLYFKIYVTCTISGTPAEMSIKLKNFIDHNLANAEYVTLRWLVSSHYRDSHGWFIKNIKGHFNSRSCNVLTHAKTTYVRTLLLQGPPVQMHNFVMRVIPDATASNRK